MLELDIYGTLVAASAVLLLGQLLVTRVPWLAAYTIPEPVAGGLMVALLGMPLSEFKSWYREKYGSDGMNDLPGRLARVEKTGTSSHNGQTAKDINSGNRAGPNESELTRDELIKAYCRLEPIRNGWKAYS